MMPTFFDISYVHVGQHVILLDGFVLVISASVIAKNYPYLDHFQVLKKSIESYFEGWTFPS